MKTSVDITVNFISQYETLHVEVEIEGEGSELWYSLVSVVWHRKNITKRLTQTSKNYVLNEAIHQISKSDDFI